MANRSGNSSSARLARMEATASYIGAGVVAESIMIINGIVFLDGSPVGISNNVVRIANGTY